MYSFGGGVCVCMDDTGSWLVTVTLLTFPNCLCDFCVTQKLSTRTAQLGVVHAGTS